MSINFSAQIIELRETDFALREQLVQSGQLSNGYHDAMKELHNRNAKALETIIDEIGYPTIDKVGKDASEAAWFVIQHSIGQPAFMKKCMKLLEEAVNTGKAGKRNFAYLSDRIAVFEAKPQLYGTQFDWDDNGLLSPNEYDNLENVNQRRASIGLNTLEEQIEVMRMRARNENQSAPADIASRRAEAEQWKKSVGWIV